MLLEYTCSRCKEGMSIHDVGSFGNDNSVFCNTCTEEIFTIKKKLNKVFDNPCCMTRRYIELVSSGIDPAGRMYPVYIDNNLMLRRREV